ncbi:MULTISPECIES: glycosyltransferase family 2 protein [unclassified Moorena]|uniref:glycosyltransferase family 2 protein n=1 Tax=unclassified Moorena TaxID=2683338 RepID=UPI0013FEB07D|nr:MULTISPECIES: glycosyltransferase family 2 protein [unclassified Moorena]NEO12389.1 glycosyltransferase family 2 protein [Moorena sp. SIO3E8]NEP97546.1 glycosyltransferase family 2 protein [Moorena sp. SIO3F7]
MAEPLYIKPEIPATLGISIFTVPKPFLGKIGIIQHNAITSWTLLKPKPEIILFGDEIGTAAIAQELGLNHIPDIECNSYGTPLLDSVFAQVQEQATYDIITYINADIILLKDFSQAIQQVYQHLETFLITGRRWNLDLSNPIEFQSPTWEESLFQQVYQSGCLGAHDAKDYFIFPKYLFPTIPKFAVGRGYWDTWMVTTAAMKGYPIVDASEVVMAVHQNHSYGHLMGGKNEAHMGKEAQQNKTIGNVQAQGTIADSTRQLKPWDDQDSPRVSVIIIVKNNSAIVERAVESVLAQNYSDYEIIVVDGAGNQGTGSREQGVGSRKQGVGSRQGSPLAPLNKGGTGINKGGTGSRNLSKGGIVIKGGCVRVAWPTANRKWGALCDRGLEMAQGEFVIFLDSDSVLLPDALEKQVAAFDRESSTLDLLLSGWQLVEGEKITQVTPWQDLPDLEDLHIWKLEKLWQPLRQSNIMFRRSRLELVGGFNTELNQDAAMVEVILNLVFLRGSRALWLPEATCSYFGQRNTIPEQFIPVAEDMKEVIDSIFKQPTVKGWMQKLKARAYPKGVGSRE